MPDSFDRAAMSFACYPRQKHRDGAAAGYPAGRAVYTGRAIGPAVGARQRACLRRLICAGAEPCRTIPSLDIAIEPLISSPQAHTAAPPAGDSVLRRACPPLRNRAENAARLIAG